MMKVHGHKYMAASNMEDGPAFRYYLLKSFIVSLTVYRLTRLELQIRRLTELGAISRRMLRSTVPFHSPCQLPLISTPNFKPVYASGTLEISARYGVCFVSSTFPFCRPLIALIHQHTHTHQLTAFAGDTRWIPSQF